MLEDFFSSNIFFNFLSMSNGNLSSISDAMDRMDVVGRNWVRILWLSCLLEDLKRFLILKVISLSSRNIRLIRSCTNLNGQETERSTTRSLTDFYKLSLRDEEKYYLAMTTF